MFYWLIILLLKYHTAVLLVTLYCVALGRRSLLHLIRKSLSWANSQWLGFSTATKTIRLIELLLMYLPLICEYYLSRTAAPLTFYNSPCCLSPQNSFAIHLVFFVAADHGKGHHLLWAETFQRVVQCTGRSSTKIMRYNAWKKQIHLL